MLLVPLESTASLWPGAGSDSDFADFASFNFSRLKSLNPLILDSSNSSKCNTRPLHLVCEPKPQDSIVRMNCRLAAYTLNSNYSTPHLKWRKSELIFWGIVHNSPPVNCIFFALGLPTASLHREGKVVIPQIFLQKKQTEFRICKVLLYFFKFEQQNFSDVFFFQFLAPFAPFHFFFKLLWRFCLEYCFFSFIQKDPVIHNSFAVA